MTREEFTTNVCCWSDLIEWCNDNNCYVCEDIYDSYSYDEYINDELSDWAREDSWSELKDRLNGLPDGYDYYRRGDYDDWDGLDDSDFDDFYRDALEWGDEHGIWDDEEDEDDGEEPLIEDDDVEEEEETPNEDISFGDLFSSCAGEVQRISTDAKEAAEREEAEAEAEFNEFMVGIVAVVEGRA